MGAHVGDSTIPMGRKLKRQIESPQMPCEKVFGAKVGPQVLTQKLMSWRTRDIYVYLQAIWLPVYI